MKKLSKSLVFFGSGDLAAKCLELLVKNFEIETVITKSSSNNSINSNNVEKIAVKNNLKILFANNSKQLDDIFNNWHPKSLVGLVIDYGVIFSQNVIDVFKLGILNSHFSLLPEWRGPDPITYSLLSGQKETGVSIMKIASEIDRGDILCQQRLAISSSDNNQSLSNKLIDVSDQLLVINLPLYISGKLKLTSQDNLPVTYSRKISKNDGFIDWNKPASVIAKEIRAFSVWPGSYTNLNNLKIIIHSATAIDGNQDPGKWIVTIEKEIFIGCRVGVLKILSVQPINKKPMLVKDFINGYSSYFE